MTPNRGSAGRSFAARLIAWQKRAGRNDLPWQRVPDPYRIWLSEIMLQQTQVATVLGYYERFLARFPDLATLAAAPVDAVMQCWSGLGYYSRARNLHRAAGIVMARHDGRLPSGRLELEALPGIGRSTAAAIAVFAHGAREAILDGNVKRVLARQFAVAGVPSERSVEVRLWELAESLLPHRSVARYTQALMDLGATLCTPRAPDCKRCPVAAGCVALARGQVEEFPARRARTRPPERGTVMLIALHAGRVLLERRPDQGLWGGLWSFPEAPDEAAALRLLEGRLGLTAREVERGPTLRHAFTHFTLAIAPLVVQVAPPASRLGEPGLDWIELTEVARQGVPVPVKRLAAGLAGPGTAVRRRSRISPRSGRAPA